VDEGGEDDHGGADGPDDLRHESEGHAFLELHLHASFE
jgi:hypothetical protein